MNALNITFFLLLIEYLQPVNLAILTIWSLFNPLAVSAPHLLSPSLADWPSPQLKSLIAHSDMHHPVSGMNSRLTSSFTCQPISVIIITLIIHSFTPGSKPTFATNPSHLNTSSTPGLPSRSWDRTGLMMLLDLFLVRFSLIFLFVLRATWLHVSVLLHVKYTASYHIVPYIHNC